jgi:hypothetical protein
VFIFVDRPNPRFLFNFNQPLKGSDGYPRPTGFVMLDNYIYIVFSCYNKVQVFDCEDRCKKIKDIKVKEMRPLDMVGSSVTSQLFIVERSSDVIWRVDLKTEVSDEFVKTGYRYTSLSLAENRLLVTSRDSLQMFDIVSGERMKKILLTEDITRYDAHHAIESNRDSFFVHHGRLDWYSLSTIQVDWDSNPTVSEIDSEGRVIRKLSQRPPQFICERLALDSVGRLLVADDVHNQVVVFDERLKYKRILIDKEFNPRWVNYDKNNKRLMIGLSNGQFKIFEY